jgi:hypothetical protein
MANIAQVLTLFCVDTMLYWAPQGQNQEGKWLYNNPPLAVAVRWEDKERERIGKEGRLITGRSYVLTGVVLLSGGLVWHGTIAQLQAITPGIPTVLQGAREIIHVDNTPGIPQFPGFVIEALLR